MNVVSFSLESINNSSVSCFAVIKWQCVWPNIATVALRRIFSLSCET